MNNKEFEIDVLPTGEIRFSRYSDEINENIMKILKNMNISSISELTEFFKSGQNIEQLFGEENLCG